MTLPEPRDVLQLLEGIGGKSVQVKTAAQTPLAGAATNPIFAGIYVADGEETPSAAVIVDLPLALAAAGALAGLPPGVIKDQLKEKSVGDVSRENLHEVLNMASLLLNMSGGKHLRLSSTEEIQSEPEGDLKAMIDSTSTRMDLEVSLAPCPPGRLTILHAA